MILSDREIQVALESGMLRITPADSAERYSSTAVDLTLDGALQFWGRGAELPANEPSFVGNSVQLQIWKFGPFNVKLTRGMPICQLIVEEVHGTLLRGYEGRFRVQGPEVTLPSQRPASSKRRSPRAAGGSGRGRTG
jgi:deoxycytidine triphosphate deaminase